MQAFADPGVLASFCLVFCLFSSSSPTGPTEALVEFSLARGSGCSYASSQPQCPGQPCPFSLNNPNPLCSYLIMYGREFVPVPKVLCPRYLARRLATLYVCTPWCRIPFRHTTPVEIPGPRYASGLWRDRVFLAAHCHHHANPTGRITHHYADAYPTGYCPLLFALRMVIFGTLRENHMSARIQCLSSILESLTTSTSQISLCVPTPTGEFQSLFRTRSG